MSRRIRPPMHPVTGHPYVDNELRNAWRAYRDYLRARPANELLLSLTLGANIWLWRSGSKPRKYRKDQRKRAYRGHFRYHPTAYYTPEKVILK